MTKLARLRFLPDPTSREDTFVGDFLRKETVGGAVALIAALVAVVWANSAFGHGYEHLREFRIGPLNVEQWAADGALTLFFFVTGLELKREFLVGSLSKISDAIVPVVAAACGVAVPALIYTVVNVVGDGHVGGWAIPSATDIAFALAVLAIVGSSLPGQLRAFLLTLAVVDDLIVIIIIAAFYAAGFDPWSLVLAGLCFAAYGLLQHLRVPNVLPYLPLAIGAWWFTHESGIHATIAGVVLGLLTRVRTDNGEDTSPAEHIEHVLSPWSAGVAVPFFALMSAGVVIGGGAELVTDPVVIGVVLGLVLGKPIGVFGGSWLLTKLTRAEIDKDISWIDVFGVAVLAGVGFTVSLLVSDLSFTGAEREAAKTAVLCGSLFASVLGATILLRRNRVHRRVAEQAAADV
ncbi:Na+/H+ antiporter NhaA [Nocardioides sp. JQ2195]|uniref:Na+/H+ antiporter NhaA n=1 Tax=Nocardioides sp. JQ2195 TaxID=2592334 RepID=UPI00143EA3D6|nr:Na+/H+ antiporter NhaA [Nocardioides sp. JQ2195]QIX28252.1 Na+/H+ antiporter NhaA [Nocardioides sp. JQ2195]